MKVEKGDNFNIPDNAEVTVIDLEEKIVVKNSLIKPSNLTNYRKIEKDKTVDIRTGEVKEYKTGGIYKDFKEKRKSMKKLKELVELNFLGEENELFITLTCSESVKDLKVIKKYRELFIRRLKNKYKECDFLYIYKFEQAPIQIQGKDDEYCWHCHLLLKDLKHKNLFIPNEIIYKIWKKGFTQTQRVFLEEKKIKVGDEEESQGISGYISKTNQLYRVKKEETIYGTSRNIKRPKIYKERFGKLRKQKLEDYYLKAENTILIRDEETNQIMNKHKTEIYKRR